MGKGFEADPLWLTICQKLAVFLVFLNQGIFGRPSFVFLSVWEKCNLRNFA
jgi:hypothetical protein